MMRIFEKNNIAEQKRNLKRGQQDDVPLGQDGQQDDVPLGQVLSFLRKEELSEKMLAILTGRRDTAIKEADTGNKAKQSKKGGTPDSPATLDIFLKKILKHMER